MASSIHQIRGSRLCSIFSAQAGWRWIASAEAVASVPASSTVSANTAMRTPRRRSRAGSSGASASATIGSAGRM